MRGPLEAEFSKSGYEVRTRQQLASFGTYKVFKIGQAVEADRQCSKEVQLETSTFFRTLPIPHPLSDFHSFYVKKCTL